MSPAKRRPRIEDLPYVVSLPQVAAFLEMAESTARASLEPRGDHHVLPVLGKELPMRKQGRRWCAWRADLAELVGEKVA